MKVHPALSLGVSHLDDFTDESELGAIKDILENPAVEGSLLQKTVETRPSYVSSPSMSSMEYDPPLPCKNFTLAQSASIMTDQSAQVTPSIDSDSYSSCPSSSDIPQRINAVSSTDVNESESWTWVSFKIVGQYR